MYLQIECQHFRYVSVLFFVAFDWHNSELEPTCSVKTLANSKVSVQLLN